MNREIIVAAGCAAATIALAWSVDHPAKIGGSILTLVNVATAWFRGDACQTSKWKRGRRSDPPSAK